MLFFEGLTLPPPTVLHSTRLTWVFW